MGILLLGNGQFLLEKLLSFQQSVKVFCVGIIFWNMLFVFAVYLVGTDPLQLSKEGLARIGKDHFVVEFGNDGDGAGFGR